jgi:hypothetical protein
MPTLKDYVPQVMRNFVPYHRVTSVISTITYFPKSLLTKMLQLLRWGNPTIDNVANAYEKSTDVSHIVKTAAYHNIVLYAAPVAGMKLFFEPAMRSFMPISFPTVLYLEEGALLMMAVLMLGSNLFYNIALTQAVAKCVPKPEEDITLCADCNWQEKLGGSVANIFLYTLLISGAGALNLSSAVIPENLSWLLQVIAYGYSLAGMQHSAHGVCTKHFSEVLNNNKLYYMSLGAMVIYSVKQTSTSFNKMTGMPQSFYVDDAIFSLVWHQAILLVVLQSKSPDYLNIVRNSIKDLQAVTMNYLLNNRYARKKRDYVTKIHALLESASGQWLLAREPVQLALNVHQEGLLSAVAWLEWLHENRMATIAVTTSTFIIDRLPKQLVGQAQLISDLLQQQDWQKLTSLCKTYLAKIELNREKRESRVGIESVQFNELITGDGERAKPDSPILAGRFARLFAANDSTSNPGTDEDYEKVGEEKVTEDQDGDPVLVEKPTTSRGHVVTTASHRR